jgi:hypothetical protein
MAKQEKNRKVSIAAVRRANESLVKQSRSLRFSSENQLAGSVVIKTIYSGRQYEINLSPSDIKNAYEQSIKAQFLKHER